MDENERIKVGMLAGETPKMFLDYLNEHFSDLLHAFGKRNLNEDLVKNDLDIDLLEGKSII